MQKEIIKYQESIKKIQKLLIIIKVKSNVYRIQTSKIPSYMMIGRLILISKDKPETPTIENTIPITIIPAIIMFLKSTILHNNWRITPATSFAKIKEGEKGKSTLDNIAEVSLIAKNIKTKTTNKEDPTMLFLTLTKTISRYQEISSSINFQNSKHHEIKQNWLKTCLRTSN